MGRPRNPDTTVKVELAIRLWIDKHGYSPTVREIMDEVGVGSSQTVWRSVRDLVAAGRVVYEFGQPRTIRLVEPPQVPA